MTNRIIGVKDPINDNDVSTKQYVDNIKLYEGYIPNLELNVSKHGFIARASSEYSSLYCAISAFNTSVFGWISNTQPHEFWLSIECPIAIRIWGFALTGDGSNNWKFEGSNDNNNWSTLYTANNEFLNSSSKIYNIINNTIYYKYYRVFSLYADRCALKIRDMQIFRYLV